MDTIKRMIIIFVLTCVIGVCSAATQCYHPTGYFAAEVLLSKPGVTYDLSSLEATGNVTVIRTSILYRSHYDDRVAVILTPLEALQEKGLDVRLQLPTKIVTSTTHYLEAEVNETVKVADLDMMGGRYLGWVLDLDYPPNPSGGPPIQVANLTKGNLKVTFIPYMNESYPDTYVRLEITNMTMISQQNMTEFSQIFDAIGYPTSFQTFVQGLEFKVGSITTEDLASRLEQWTNEQWTEAMKIELEWLTRNRIIRGLTDNDIETISAYAPYAWGEHNYKLRWYKDHWELGITEEMLEEEFTLQYLGPPNCEGFDPDVLPDQTIVDFNASFQPLDILFEQTFLGAGIRAVLIIVVILAMVILFVRRRRRGKHLVSR